MKKIIVLSALLATGGIWYFTTRPEPANPVPAAQAVIAPSIHDRTAGPVGTVVQRDGRQSAGAAVATVAAKATGDQHAANCTHCAEAAKQATAKADMPQGESRPVLAVDASFVQAAFGGSKGDAIELALPGGKTMKGVVEMTREENGKVVEVSGSTTEPEAGMFFFIANQSEGVAGPYSGVVRFTTGSEVAYAIEPTQDGKAAVLVEKHLADVICHGFAAMPRATGTAAGVAKAAAAAAPIIKLESRPGARGVIYLDFDGETGPFPGWGDFNAEAPVVSDASVTEVWQRVVEDYAPFDLNVTTDLAVYQAAPRTSRIQCVLTPTTAAAPGAGGVAYLGSFNWDKDQKICWAFYATGKAAAEVVSHEVGHTFGMSHDGRTSPAEEYYGGQGSGDVGWAPIMGVGYYKNLSQWSKGEYKNPTRASQDDLAMIEGANNVTYLVDDHGDTLDNATKVAVEPGSGSQSIALKGVISTPQDVDSFLIRIGNGNISLNAAPVALGPNLDILLEVYDLAGTLMIQSNPDKYINATAGIKLKEGTYLVKISGVGRGDPLTDGYTDYGSLGQYTLNCVVPRPPSSPDDHGDSFVNATTVNPPALVPGIMSAVGDVDTFTFSVQTAAIYVIESSGNIDLKGTLYDKRYLPVATDDDSAPNRNFRIRKQLLPGVYFLQVRGSSGTELGYYAISIKVEVADIPDIAVLGGTGTTIPNGDLAPSTIKGNNFGTVAPNNSKTLDFTIQNAGITPLILSGTPLVRISGAAATSFSVTAQPTTPIAANGGVSPFTITYKPTKVGTHVATVQITSNDPDAATYTFSIQGSADSGPGNFATAEPVEVPGSMDGRIAAPGEADLYRFIVAEAGTVVVATEGSTDTLGMLYDGNGKYLQQDDDGGDGTNFRITRVVMPGLYFVKVSGRTAVTLGDYKLVVTFDAQRPDIQLVGLANANIPNGSTVTTTTIGTDFGTINAASGYQNRVFNIKNTGLAPLNLSGSPLVSLAGTSAAHFQVVQQPTASIGSGSIAPFTLRFNPAFAGTHTAVVTIASNDPDENPYTFAIKGVGTGLADDHESSFEGATILNFAGDPIKGVLERGGDVDMFRFTVPQKATVRLESTGAIDTKGALYDSSRRLLAKDEDAGEGSNFRISVGLNPGTYYLQVQGFSAAVTGEYAIKTGVN